MKRSMYGMKVKIRKSRQRKKKQGCQYCRFLSRRFYPKSRRLFPFYFSNIMLRTDLLTFGVTGTVFKIAGEMRQLLAYFDNPVTILKQDDPFSRVPLFSATLLMSPPCHYSHFFLARTKSQSVFFLFKRNP